MMWKPSVNAIWLRAATRFDASMPALGLQSRLRGDAARRNGLLERVVVAFVLIGVGLGEDGNRLVEDAARAEVARDRGCVARAGGCFGQRPPEIARVDLERVGRQRLDERRAIGVRELANVEVALAAIEADGGERAEHDVACRLRQPLTLDDPLTVGRELALAEVGLEHRRLGLLRLQKERIAAVSAEQQHDPGAGSDAADTDDLARGVDVAEAREQLLSVMRERAPVVADQAVRDFVCVLSLSRIELG